MLNETIQKSIKKDHETIRKLIKELEKAIEEKTADRQIIFDQLAAEVLAHSKAEEDVLYEALLKEDEEKMTKKIEEGKEEHHVAEILIAEMRSLSPDDSKWQAKLEVLRESLEHHLNEEEKDILRPSKSMIDKEDATQMSEEFREEKAEIKEKN